MIMNMFKLINRSSLSLISTRNTSKIPPNSSLTRSYSEFERFQPKCKDGFVLDKRAQGSRESINSNLILNDKSFRFEIADSLDYTMLVKFFGENYICKDGMFKYLGGFFNKWDLWWGYGS